MFISLIIEILQSIFFFTGFQTTEVLIFSVSAALALSLIYILFFYKVELLLKAFSLSIDDPILEDDSKPSQTNLLELLIFGIGFYFLMGAIPRVLYWLISRFKFSVSHPAANSATNQFSVNNIDIAFESMVVLVALCVIIFRKPLMGFLSTN